MLLPLWNRLLLNLFGPVVVAKNTTIHFTLFALPKLSGAQWLLFCVMKSCQKRMNCVRNARS